MNKSETVSFELCTRSFLSLWSFASPRLGNGKELCDILVVFGSDVIIVSVKEIKFGKRADEDVNAKRWRREAIEKSVKQIYKAEKWIRKGLPVFSGEMKPILMPDPKNLKIHRIAIALGSRGMVGIESGDFGRGFTHVYNEDATFAVLRELDTIRDFLDYLDAVESFLSSSRARGILLQGGHKDLLGLYLLKARTFPSEADLLVLGDDIWQSFESRPEVNRRREEDKKSYLWDALIETLAEHQRSNSWEYSLGSSQAELVLRTMAAETRFSRRILGQQFDDILRTTPTKATRSKLVQSPSGIVYVFLVTPKKRDRKERRAELAGRCLVARDIIPVARTVVGIATETYEVIDPGFSFDVFYLDLPKWSTSQHSQAQKLGKKYGWFPARKRKTVHLYEYRRRGTLQRKMRVTIDETRTPAFDSTIRNAPCSFEALGSACQEVPSRPYPRPLRMLHL